MSTTPYRIAFLTDIHGNLHALEATLRAIRAEAPDLVIVGGDLTFKFPHPRETLELLATVEHRAIAGNTERYVVEWSAPGAWPAFLAAWGGLHARWTREQIGEGWAGYLADLPGELSFTVAGAAGGAGEVLVVHGVPGNPFVGIHGAPGPDNLHPRWALPDDALDAHLAGVRAGLILAGHTHIPTVRRWRDSLIVNPGAVAYGWRPAPDTHLARYALLTRRSGSGWEVELRAVPYDNEAAVRGLREIAAHNEHAARVADLITPPVGARVG